MYHQMHADRLLFEDLQKQRFVENAKAQKLPPHPGHPGANDFGRLFAAVFSLASVFKYICVCECLVQGTYTNKGRNGVERRVSGVSSPLDWSPGQFDQQRVEATFLGGGHYSVTPARMLPTPIVPTTNHLRLGSKDSFSETLYSCFRYWNLLSPSEDQF